MVTLKLLGSADLRNDRGRELRRILRRPKRLALLAYLAGNAPRVYHRRDRLLALFWPESTADQARHGLRQVLYELRNHLGENAILRRGTEEIGLSEALVTCDVAQLHIALAEGDLDRATELYHGAFLDGFFVSGMPEVEEWIETRRAEILRLVVAATWELADRCVTHGNAMGAATAAQRAVELAPTDEVGVRRLLGLLERVGNNGEALRVYDRLARRLAEEFNIGPSPETTALIEQIREANGAAAPQRPTASTSYAASSDEVSRLGEPEATPRIRSRPFGYVLVGTVIAALFAGAAWWATNRPGAAPAPDVSPSRVAVFPARVLASDSTYLVDAIADLLHAALDGAGELRGVDPHALYAALKQRSDNRDLSPDEAFTVAQGLGAGLFVLSRAVDMGGRLRVTGQLYDVSRGTDAYVTSVAESDVTELRETIEEVAWGLVSQHPVGSGMHLAEVASLRPANYTALKAYLEGEANTRRGDFPAAVTAFTRAIEADSIFGLAWFRRAHIQAWFAGARGSRSRSDAALQTPQLFREAMRHQSGLSWSDSLLLSGWHAHLTGDPDRAHEFANTLLASYPEHVEGRFLRAGIRGWHGWRYGEPLTAAREAFERVVELDPGHPQATRWLTGLYLFERRYTEARELAGESQLIAFMMGDKSAQDAVIEELRSGPDAQVEWTAYMLGASGHLKSAVRVSEVLLDSARQPHGQSLALGLLLGSHLEVARGRWQTASKKLTRLGAFAPELALVHKSLLAMTPLLDIPDADLRVLLDSLEHWTGAFSSTPSVAVGGPLLGLAIPPEFVAHMRAYLLGLLHATLDEREDALRYAAQIQRSARVSDTLGLLGDAALDIQAMVALSNDKPGAAITLLEGAALSASPTDQRRSFLYARSLHRMLRADALARAGRYEEALGWYSTVPVPLFPDKSYIAVSHHQRAQILAQLGDSTQAIEHYSMFIDMWAEADYDRQALVMAARHQISQLRGDLPKGLTGRGALNSVSQRLLAGSPDWASQRQERNWEPR